MDTQDNQKTDYQEQGPKKGIVIIVITILLGTNGLLLWQFFEKKNCVRRSPLHLHEFHWTNIS